MEQAIPTEGLPDRQPRRTVLRKAMISAFVILYVSILSLWLMPKSPVHDAILSPFSPYVYFLGLDQEWTMFSPHPRITNVDLSALITFADGTSMVWQYPRVEKFNYLDRMQMDLFRKFGHDHMNWEDDEFLCPGFCQWLAREISKGGKTPAVIALERHEAEILPPEKGMGKPLPPHEFSFQFFTYQVKPQDLR